MLKKCFYIFWIIKKSSSFQSIYIIFTIVGQYITMHRQDGLNREHFFRDFFIGDLFSWGFFFAEPFFREPFFRGFLSRGLFSEDRFSENFLSGHFFPRDHLFGDLFFGVLWHTSLTSSVYCICAFEYFISKKIVNIAQCMYLKVRKIINRY